MQTNSCILCEQDTVTSKTPPSLTSASPSTVTLVMEQTWRRIDDAISTLCATRINVMRHLNNLRSPSSKLPLEILSEIFTYVSDSSAPDLDRGWGYYDDPETHLQISLASVSLYWRQVIFSTPKLWAKTFIRVRPKTIGFKVKLPQLYLKTVQCTPLSLCLRIEEPPFTDTDFTPILQAIQDGAQKFTFLDLCARPITWLPILSPHLQKLKRLHLVGTTDRDIFPCYLSNIPSLCRVSLTYCSLGRAPPNQPCLNITNLHLAYVLESTCVQLLMSCPNLINYRCEKPSLDPNFKDLPSDTAVFHNMQFIHIPNSAARPFGELLPQLRFPVLETFSMELCNPVPYIENLLSFIQRLPATCSALKITTPSSKKMVITRIIQAVPPQVQSLELPEPDVSEMLRALYDTTDTGSFKMPGIRHIYVSTWGCCGFVGRRGKRKARLFLDMVSARKRKGLLGGRFMLEVKYDDSTCWTHLQDRLRTLVSDGFRLEIFVAGVLIPGLQEIYEELGS